MIISDSCYVLRPTREGVWGCVIPYYFFVSKKVLQWGKNIRDDIQSIIKLTINDQIAMQKKNFNLQNKCSI